MTGPRDDDDAGLQGIRFGAQLWSQATDWPSLRDAALLAEDSGWDSVWTWDHLYAITGPWEQSILEGWSVLSALGPLTTRVRLGLMVGANTLRNPGLTAKLATTLDHVSGGRAILGIGAAWFEREHQAFGFDFGSGFGERLDRLDESVGLIRRLLDGETVTHQGRFYTMNEALCAPRPIQAHLPILIGASGPRKGVPAVGRHADAWNTSGPLADVAARVPILEEAAREAGRDSASIERSISFPILIRDDLADAQRAFEAILAHNRATTLGRGDPVLGSPATIAAALRPYVELGFRTVIVRLPAPYDRETIERIDEVAALLAGPKVGAARGGA